MNQNNDKQLAKFNLCKSLVELLGAEQATADLYKLYHRHPEMFKNEYDLKATIEQVVNKPDLITKNPKPQSDRDFMAYKQISDKKIADVGIRNDNGANTIFHANKKNTEKVSKDIRGQMLVETPSAKAAPTRLNHCANELNNSSRCNNALSAPVSDIIPQDSNQSQTESRQKQIADMQERVKNAVNKGIAAPQTPNKDKEMER